MKIRKLILLIAIMVITSFIVSTIVSSNADITNQRGIATVSGSTDPENTIQISLPNGKVMDVTPNSSGQYSVDISGLSVGDNIYVTAINDVGQKSNPTKYTITTADVVEQDDLQSNNSSSISNISSKSKIKKDNQSFPWLSIIFWAAGAIGITAGGTAIVTSRYPNVKRSIFTLVGSRLLWRSQQDRHKVKLVGKLTDVNKKNFFGVTSKELHILVATGEVELSRQFTQYEVKVFNRQNDDVKMVLVYE